MGDRCRTDRYVNHRCPPDVSFDDYKYYLKRKRQLFNIPEPAPWEERKEG